MEWIEADADGKAVTADEFLEKKKQLEEAVQSTMDKVRRDDDVNLMSNVFSLIFFESACTPAVPSTPSHQSRRRNILTQWLAD